MRVDLHPIFNIELFFCDFYNVDLDDRGFYQIRLIPKTSPDFLSIEIVNSNRCDVSDASTSTSRRSKLLDRALGAHVLNNTIGVSSTVEVRYIDECLPLNDLFTISLQLTATTDFNSTKSLTFDLEIWFLDRFSDPLHDEFAFLSRRTMQMTMDFNRLTAVTRAIYWECSDAAATTIRAYSSMVSVVPRRRKPPPDSPLSVKLHAYYKSVCLALLRTTESIVSHQIAYRKLITDLGMREAINVDEELKVLLKRIEESERPWATLEAECVTLSARLTSIFESMVQNMITLREITDHQLIDYAKWRRSVLSETFFCREYSKTNILGQSSVNASELFATVSKGKYLLKLPKFALSCAATDSPADACPIIFEDVFTAEMRSDGGIDFEDDENSKFRRKKNSASLALKKIRKESVKSLSFLKPKKPIDPSEATMRKVVRSRTKTLAAMEGLVAAVTDSETIARVGNTLRASLSLNDVSADSVEPEESSTGDYNSAEDSPVTTSSLSAVSIAMPVQNVTELDLQAKVDFIKEREAMKERLRTACFYDGFVHSERASTSLRPLQCHPCTWVGSPRSHHNMSSIHLVVYVHGLGGSRDDLAPYRRVLEQTFSAHKECMKYDQNANMKRGRSESPNEEDWDMESLMSRVNQTETWSDINTMAHNLLNEISEYVAEKQSRVRRISLISHSLGGVIVRAAIRLATDARMPWLLPLLHTCMTINTPHLGLAYTGRHITWGVQFVRWWKRSRSMEQLAFRDASNITNTFLYKLSQENTLGEFKHVILLGNPEDLFVPMQSALVEHSKASARDSSSMGTVYRNMVSNVLSNIRDSQKTETLVRYMTVHRNQTASANKLTGRAAHIAPVEDYIFIEKLFLVSALKYFV